MARDFERYSETAKAFIHITVIKLMKRRMAQSVNSQMVSRAVRRRPTTIAEAA